MTTPSPEALALKPCPVPWCSSKPRMVNMHGIKAYVVCNNCGCCGPESNDKTLAAAAWNTRPTPTDSGEVIQGDPYQIASILENWTDDGALGRPEDRLICAETILAAVRDHRLAFSRPEPVDHTDVLARRMGAEFVARPEPVGDEALVGRVARAAKGIRSKFDKRIDELTKQAIDDSLCEIERAFDALVADRNEWRDQHENLLSVRQSDLAAIQAIPAPATGEREQIVETARIAEDSRLDHITSALLGIVAKIDDEGDRSYFGSTNDADELKELAHEMDAMRWPTDHRLAFSRPEPVEDEALVERVARAIHEHLSRRDIMAYLNNEEDCEGLARAAIQAIPAPATDAGQSADSLVWALREIEAAWASNNAEGDDYDEGFDDGLKRACEIAREALAEWTASLPKSPSAGEG